MVIFTARQNLANLNEVKMNLIVKFANLAEKSYIFYFIYIDFPYTNFIVSNLIVVMCFVPHPRFCVCLCVGNSLKESSLRSRISPLLSFS